MQFFINQELVTGSTFVPEDSTEEHKVIGFMASKHGVWMMYTVHTDRMGVSHVSEWRMDEPSPWMVWQRTHPKGLLDIVHASFNSLAATAVPQRV